MAKYGGWDPVEAPLAGGPDNPPEPTGNVVSSMVANAPRRERKPSGAAVGIGKIDDISGNRQQRGKAPGFEAMTRNMTLPLVGTKTTGTDVIYNRGHQQAWHPPETEAEKTRKTMTAYGPVDTSKHRTTSPEEKKAALDKVKPPPIMNIDGTVASTDQQNMSDPSSSTPTPSSSTPTLPPPITPRITPHLKPGGAWRNQGSADYRARRNQASADYRARRDQGSQVSSPKVVPPPRIPVEAPLAGGPVNPPERTGNVVSSMVANAPSTPPKARPTPVEAPQHSKGTKQSEPDQTKKVANTPPWMQQTPNSPIGDWEAWSKIRDKWKASQADKPPPIYGPDGQISMTSAEVNKELTSYGITPVTKDDVDVKQIIAQRENEADERVRKEIERVRKIEIDSRRWDDPERIAQKSTQPPPIPADWRGGGSENYGNSPRGRAAHYNQAGRVHLMKNSPPKVADTIGQDHARGVYLNQVRRNNLPDWQKEMEDRDRASEDAITNSIIQGRNNRRLQYSTPPSRSGDQRTGGPHQPSHTDEQIAAIYRKNKVWHPEHNPDADRPIRNPKQSEPDQTKPKQQKPPLAGHHP